MFRTGGRTAAIARWGSALALIALLATPAAGRPIPAIRALDQRWSPTSITVPAGSTIRWRGVNAYHDVLAYGGDWTFHRQLPVGSVVRRRFRIVGTYRFRCTYHSTLIGNTCYGMCGSVVVRR